MQLKVNIMIMSGVEDGTLLEYNTARGDGKTTSDKWTLSLGRKDENDVCLRNDTYISRQHANLHRKNEMWWLEDCDSTNGTFLANVDNFFDDVPVKGIVPLEEGQLFRVGRTWLRIQLTEQA
ncbi:MAG: FHA domain-containing protein [bacterium]|jgi:pSer/pThr/pTyr-binding forkhead associated (FHA) protein|nr:FHA domain-containing protein [bacterium]